MQLHAIDVEHPDLAALFDENGPHAPMVFAVLGGRSPGRALADDPHRPKLAIVQTFEGLALASCAAPRLFVDAGLEALRADSMVGLVWQPNDGPEPQVPAKRVERVDFAALDPTTESLARQRSMLPPGFEVASFTPDLLERAEWGSHVAAAAGGNDAFLETGLGLCLIAGDDIASEAYAPFVGRLTAEIGVVTAERHRGRGLAAIAVAFLAERMASRDLSLYWSCDAENAASINVAGKLGFARPRRYEMLLYSPLPVVGG